MFLRGFYESIFNPPIFSESFYQEFQYQMKSNWRLDIGGDYIQVESFEQKELCAGYGKAPAAGLATKGNREQKDRVHMLKSKPGFWNRLCCQQQHRYEEFQPLLPTVGRQTRVTQAHPVLTFVPSSLRLVVGHSWSIWVTYHLFPKHIGIIKLPVDTASTLWADLPPFHTVIALGSNSFANICQELRFPSDFALYIYIVSMSKHCSSLIYQISY